MDFINKYNNPTITHWELDDNGNKISIQVLNEKITVVDGKATLMGLPDEQYRVYIDNLNEVDITEPIKTKRQFKVDYKHSGVVYFHEDVEGQTFTVNRYYSKGVVYYPASRVWTKLGSAGEVVETLDVVIEEVSELMDSVEIAKQLNKDLIDNTEIANNKNDILNETIKQAEKTKVLFDDIVELGNETIKNVENSISSVDEVVAKLNAGVENADNKSNEFNQSVENAEKLINQTISNAKTENADLSEVINSANSINTSLVKIINTGELVNSDIQKIIDNAKAEGNILSQKIENGTITVEDIQNSINKGSSQNKELNSTIDIAKDLNDRLNAIIEGTDFENVISDISELKENISKKVDKVSGKGLSTNDYTNKEKSEVAKIKNKIDKSEVLSIFTQENEPKEMKTGDQWHQIIE